MPRQLNPKTLLQLRIELDYTKPAIWRSVWVPDSITLMKLHSVIQESMGWWDSHLHEFDFAGLRYGAIDPDWGDELDLIDEKRKKLP